MSVQNIDVDGEASLDNMRTSAEQSLARLASHEDWDVTVSRHPLKERVTVRVSADIGVLTYYIKVVPQESAPARGVDGMQSFHGYRVERWHSATPEDGETIIDDGIYGQMQAFDIAREEMERLTS